MMSDGSQDAHSTPLFSGSGRDCDLEGDDEGADNGARKVGGEMALNTVIQVDER